MKRWKAYGYNMHSDVFKYNGRNIDGLLVSIIIPSTNSERQVQRNVSIRYTKEDGFTVAVKCNAKNIVVQPYKIYFCAEPTDGQIGLETIEVSSTVLEKYSAYYHEGMNCSVESCWLVH